MFICVKVAKLKCNLQASMYHGGRAWLSDPEGPNYLAGRKATKHVYGVDPDMTREGGSIPVTLTLQVMFTCMF